MPQSALPVNYRIANLAFFPEMYITAADSCCADVDETFIWSRGGNVRRCLDDQVVCRVGGDGDVGGFGGEDLGCRRHLFQIGGSVRRNWMCKGNVKGVVDVGRVERESRCWIYVDCDPSYIGQGAAAVPAADRHRCFACFGIRILRVQRRWISSSSHLMLEVIASTIQSFRSITA